MADLFWEFLERRDFVCRVLRNVGFLQDLGVILLLGPLSAMGLFLCCVCSRDANLTALLCACAANTVICDVFMHFCQDSLCSCAFWRLAFPKTHLPNFRTLTVFVGRVLGMVAKGWTLVTDFLLPHPCAVCCTKRRKRCKYQCFGHACNMNDALIPPTPPTPPPSKRSSRNQVRLHRRMHKHVQTQIE